MLTPEREEKIASYIIGIEDVCPGNWPQELLDEIGRLRAQVEALREALREAIDVAVWMSGSPSFAPDGEAGEAWPKQRERLYASMEVERKVSGAGGKAGKPGQHQRPCDKPAPENDWPRRVLESGTMDAPALRGALVEALRQRDDESPFEMSEMERKR